MKKLSDSIGGFKYAVEGIVHAFRTQKHMRFHFVAVILAGIFCLLFKMNYIEIILIIISICFVIFAEMINTAIEIVVDLETLQYHPLAKFAKDIAAGAVLVAVMNAVIVGILLIFNRGKINQWQNVVNWDKPDIIVVGTILAIIMLSLIVMYKVSGNKGKIWRGGIISIHSAIGFFLAWTGLFIENKTAVTIIALTLAALIAQSRVEGGIHTLSEVIWGALIATVIAFVGYMVFAPVF